MITRTRFVLAVPDLARSVAYYCDVLGFDAQDMGDAGWCFLQRDECGIMMGHCPDALPPGEIGDHSYFAYWMVDDIDAYYAMLCTRSVDFIKAISNEPWGMREFGIRTIDGHRIMVGQPIEN